MNSATRASSWSDNSHIVSLDVGTSSVRSLLFDSRFRQLDGVGGRIEYDLVQTRDGGVEIDPGHLFDLTVQTLDRLHHDLSEHRHEVAAVATSAFWHSFLGVDESCRPTTPIIHLFDTRSGPQVDWLRARLDPVAVHRRTGCILHSSYWPAKLLWLSQNRADDFRRTRRWLSFGEFLLLRLHGAAPVSTSMMSGSGIWQQATNEYDSELLGVLPVDASHLAQEFDTPCTGLTNEWAARWPLLARVPWFPAFGDGACSNVGSGCVARHQLALMVGTSGAMRIAFEGPAGDIPNGLWCYRLDRQRCLVGGALSNGGEVFKWLERTLQLPADAEAQLVSREPDSHRLTMLPYFAGERSPYWRADLRAVIAGLSFSTTALDILQAGMESVALRFRQIFDLLTPGYGIPRQIVTSGGALLHSDCWSQMMANALGQNTIACVEPEASARGAALLAAAQWGLIDSLHSFPARLGRSFQAEPNRTRVFERMLARDVETFARLFQ